MACYENSCAVIRKIPRPKYKILKRARKKTGIKPNIEAINWVDSICGEINRGENVARTAKEILEKYKEKYPEDYYGKIPSITAAAAVYMACRSCNEQISQYDLRKQLGITDQTIRKRYREISEKL